MVMGEAHRRCDILLVRHAHERQGTAIDGDLLHLPQCVVLLVLRGDKLADQSREVP
jgi:hypothetical protein